MVVEEFPDVSGDVSFGGADGFFAGFALAHAAGDVVVGLAVVALAKGDFIPLDRTMTGTITETLEDGPTLAFRDRDAGAVVRIWVTPAFVMRTRGSAYVTADALRVNDTAVIDAFRGLDAYFLVQQFVAENLAGTSYYRLRNVNSGKCLNVYSGVVDAAHEADGGFRHGGAPGRS